MMGRYVSAFLLHVTVSSDSHVCVCERVCSNTCVRGHVWLLGWQGGRRVRDDEVIQRGGIRVTAGRWPVPG